MSAVLCRDRLPARQRPVGSRVRYCPVPRTAPASTPAELAGLCSTSDMAPAAADHGGAPRRPCVTSDLSAGWAAAAAERRDLAHQHLIRPDQRERRPRRDLPARRARLRHRHVCGQAGNTPAANGTPPRAPRPRIGQQRGRHHPDHAVHRQRRQRCHPPTAPTSQDTSTTPDQARTTDRSPRAGQLETHLRHLGISDPELLLHAAALDNAARSLTTEAQARAQQLTLANSDAKHATGCHMNSRTRHRIAQLAAQDIPDTQRVPTEPAPGTQRSQPSTVRRLPPMTLPLPRRT